MSSRSDRVTIQINPDHGYVGHQLTLIDALARYKGAPLKSYGEIVRVVSSEYHFPGRNEPLTLAGLLGLLDKSASGFVLSPTAWSIHAMAPAVRSDMMHFLLWSAWKPGANGALGISWSYRAFCNRLWDQQVVHLTSGEVASVVADLLGEAREVFLGADSLAYRPDSVRGLRRWLHSLDPPVMDGDVFRRREVCSREVLLLALGQVAREDGAELGVDLLLTPERRKAICRICLLEPAALDRRLDHMLPSFPRLVAPGTRTGAYGRFVRLLAHPEITSLVG